MANKTIEVVLIRHAQSEWNKKDLFSGWADPHLTESGIAEAERAGELLRDAGYVFNVAYASKLTRAIHTRDLILSKLAASPSRISEDWRLNERHYGVLQGLSKSGMAKVVGEEQVMQWRRSYEEAAEPFTRRHKHHPANDERYSDVPEELLPGAENLKMTQERVMAFWQERMAEHFANNDRVLISSHGNTLRALIMALSNMSKTEVEKFEIPTGTPIVYTFDDAGRPVEWAYLNKKS